MPACISAARFTSAKRTCSITCWLAMPPGSCSMLTTRALPLVAATTSAARSITALVDTWPERIIGLVVDRDPDVLAWEELCSVCCSVVTPGSTTTSYCSRRPAPHTIRLTVPALLPSISTSRG